MSLFGLATQTWRRSERKIFIWQTWSNLKHIVKFVFETTHREAFVMEQQSHVP
jgi:hypothetical protein